MIHNQELQQKGYLVATFQLHPVVKNLVEKSDWESLDYHFHQALQSKGYLFQQFKQFGDFNKVEHIISIRDANDPDQEDGIWHDDGSRNFAISLSLTQEKIEGGKLGFRKRGHTEIYIETPNYGEGIIFLTGNDGYEHKICKVFKGKRIILVIWISE